MKSLVSGILFLGALILVSTAGDGLAAEPAAKGRVFELRTYVTNSGKLPDLHKRFRDHTCRLFQKHGIELVGFWTPTTGPEAENTLIYLVAFPSLEAQKKAWKEFGSDPVWLKAKEESHKGGVIVKELKTQNLAPTDYSPIR